MSENEDVKPKTLRRGGSRRGAGALGGLIGFFGALTATSGLVLVTSIGMTVAFYGILFFVGSVIPDQYIYVTWCERGWIPYASTFLFHLAIAMLLQKYHRVDTEWKAFDLEDEILPRDVSTTIQRESADAIAAKIHMLAPRQRNFLLIQRLDRSLQRLRNTGSSADMSSLVNDLSSIDRQTAESGYTIVRFLLAVIPILGFIGTVLGISIAISTFAAAIASSESFSALKPQLKDVTWNLGVAFETTLVALLQSAVIMLLNTAVQKREDDLLTSIDDFCITRILSRLRVGGDGAQSAGDAVSRELGSLNVSVVEKSRDVEDAIREVGEEICTWLKRAAGGAAVPPAGAPAKRPGGGP